MRGIAYINDDMYYERPDGTYAKMPYHDGKAVAEIIIARATPEELRGFIEGAFAAALERNSQPSA